MIFAVTIGFDEKFALRAITRRGAKEEDEIIVLMAKDSNYRSEKALRNFTEVIEKAFQKVKVTRIDVDVRNFSEAVIKLVEEFQKRNKSDFLINLSGGFRLLILETLIAAILTRINAKIEIELEDSSVIVEFPIGWITSKILDEETRKILKALEEKSMNISEIVESTKLSKTTVWRRLSKLKDIGIVSYEESKSKYSLTNFGKIMISIK